VKLKSILSHLKLMLNRVIYSTREREDLTLVEFNIEGGVLDVSELEEAIRTAPAVNWTKGVCISGRGPVWLYAALTHKYHPAPFIATYEPRMNSCIVVASHTPKYRIGDVIPL